MSEPAGWAALADRYRFEREIGRGGMACVYLAEELRYRRPVAVKILREELASAVGHDRFLREIQFAAELSHPNIVPLLDSGMIPPDTAHPPRPWFAMPYVGGESLKDRLARGPLQLDELLDVLRPVAAALDHAHACRIVHRDVKPGNILLVGGTAVVADFGIAHAIGESADSPTLTESGIVLGTPEYMAPEQASGDEAVDGRADVYGLACVVFEALGGRTPFGGASPLAILSRHRTAPPPVLAELRADLPPGISAAVARALSKHPADRFPSAGAFAEAVRHGAARGSSTLPITLLWGPRRRSLIMGAGLMVGATAVLAITRPAASPVPGLEAAGDTLRYVVLPFEHGPGVDGRLGGEEIVRDALSRWRGISVADPLAVGERIGTAVPRSASEAAAVAHAFGAGRYLRASVTAFGDSLRIRATVLDTRSAQPLATGQVVVHAALGGVAAALAALADSLLLRDALPPGTGGPSPHAGGRSGTRSLAAYQAFGRASARLATWDLDAASQEFAAAAELDPSFVQASLWLAVTRSWAGLPPATWRGAAIQAEAGADRLDPRDRRFAGAMSARAAGDLAAACAAWQHAADSASNDYAAWYGLGDCLVGDNTVLRDRASPSGWRFRTSWHAALEAVRRAYLLLPSVHFALGGPHARRIRRVFMLSESQIRTGRAGPPDTGAFVAQPGWAADTLSLVPWPERRISAAVAGPPPVAASNRAEAVRQQRLLLRETAAAWVAAYPRSAAARFAMAQALELLGDPTALAGVQEARRLATDSATSRRLAVAEVWLRVKRALPRDTADLARALLLADSLLAAPPDSSGAAEDRLAGLAALGGRAEDALALLRHAGAGMADLPPGLTHDAPTLELLAAYGGPADSLAALERTVSLTIDRRVVAASQQAARMRWLALPATLAWPAYRSPFLARLAGEGDWFLDALAAVERGDTAAALRAADAAARQREATGSGTVTIDQLPALAALYAAAGRLPTAVTLLDESLAHIRDSDTDDLSHPFRAASLGRAIALRADLAAHTGDRAAAATWARALLVLWREADPLLAPVLRRMEELAR